MTLVESCSNPDRPISSFAECTLKITRTRDNTPSIGDTKQVIAIARYNMYWTAIYSRTYPTPRYTCDRQLKSATRALTLLEMAGFERLPVRMAASFSKLARSAPEKPGTRIATLSKLTSSPNFLLRACTPRISNRPATSGTSTLTCRN